MQIQIFAQPLRSNPWIFATPKRIVLRTRRTAPNSLRTYATKLYHFPTLWDLTDLCYFCILTPRAVSKESLHHAPFQLREFCDKFFLFGDGIYEVIPVYDGRAFRFAAHAERILVAGHAPAKIHFHKMDTNLQQFFTQLRKDEAHQPVAFRLSRNVLLMKAVFRVAAVRRSVI